MSDGIRLAGALPGDEDARERGCTRGEWTTDAPNAGARAFYDSLGAAPLASKLFYRATLPQG